MKKILSLRNVAALALIAAASAGLTACGTDIRDERPEVDSGTQQPPADSGTTPPPADSGMQQPPADASQPPADSGMQMSPPVTCAAGQTDCNRVCRELQTDALNCGACNRACPSGQVCTAGACANPIPTCPGANLSSDTANCGRCGNRCATGESCTGGMCTAPTEDSYEYTVVAPRQMMSITLDDFWGGSHSVANYQDPGRNRMLTTHTMSFRVPRGAYIALNDTFVYDSSGRNVTVFGCAVERVGGPFVTTGTRTLRRNGVAVVMTVTGDNMGRDGCNFEAADRPAPWR